MENGDCATPLISARCVWRPVCSYQGANKGGTMITRSKRLIGLGVLGIFFLMNPALVKASPSSCDTVSGNLITVNCGFEAGVVGNAPLGWVTDAGFALHVGGFNQVVNGNAHSGSNALQFGNFDSEPPAGISQTFADTNGQNYTVTFFMFDGGAANQDAGAFFDAQINGSNMFTRTGKTAPAAYPGTGFTFSFTGTGSDTLSFLADTTPSEFYLDDISVVANGSTNTPEPTSMVLLGSGLAGLWFKRRGAKTA